MDMSLFGGITYTESGWTLAPSLTWMTFIGVTRWRISTMIPLWVRVHVLDDDECHAALLGHVAQELLQGLQPAC